MVEKPILFCTEMVQALLQNRKSETRRVIKPQPEWCRIAQSEPYGNWEWRAGVYHTDEQMAIAMVTASPHQVGDILWVKETFVLERVDNVGELPLDDRPTKYVEELEDHHWLVPHYRATEPEPHIVTEEQIMDNPMNDRTRWTSPLFMPKFYTRIWLEVMGVKAERVQDINTDDILREGLTHRPGHRRDLYELFEQLWDKLNAKRGFPFSSNPWVQVVQFEKVGGCSASLGSLGSLGALPNEQGAKER